MLIIINELIVVIIIIISIVHRANDARASGYVT
jgi:hypothetical protein